MHISEPVLLSAAYMDPIISGSIESSPSSQQIYDPVTASRHAFLAVWIPPFSLWIALILLSLSAYSSMIREDESVDPSSTMMISRFS